MQERGSTKPVRTLGVGAAALALALAWGSGFAFAEDDDENVPLDTKLFRQFMKDIGATRDGPQIEYRERAPLVVPPTRNLPPPRQEGTAAASNPAWPKDPDVAHRRKAASAAERARLKASAEGSIVDESRPLRPDELNQGRAPARKPAAAAREADDAMRPMNPAELGQKRTIFDSMFQALTPSKPETATFTNEPPRTSMTAPPSGYQTPSPSQPYGLGKKDDRKASTVIERTEVAR